MITVLGSKGFIGSKVVNVLKAKGHELYLPDRNEDLKGKKLGNVIFCIGLTGDAKRKPFETVNAHINKLSEIIQFSQIDSITYASSTRIYIHNLSESVNEKDTINVNVYDPFELFNLTKLTAESLLFNSCDNFKIIRYSNVYGLDIYSENFLTSIISEALKTGKINLMTSKDSAKDYISVDDAAELTVQIALKGESRIYNVASGVNTTNLAITDKISSVTGCEVFYKEDAKYIGFPAMDISQVKSEFNYHPTADILTDVGLLVHEFQKSLQK